MKNSESEGSEGCEASFSGAESQAVDRYEATLGIPVEKAIDLWRSEGAPMVNLGLGEICLDLEKLLSYPNIKPEQLEAVKKWLQQHKKSDEQ